MGSLVQVLIPVTYYKSINQSRGIYEQHEHYLQLLP